ncbi:MAG: DUF3604 domain-containing protein [Acidobacteriota bacterium]
MVESEWPDRQPRLELVESLRADLEAPRHPADGGGRAWLETSSAVTASTRGRWTLLYEAGELGVAQGGMAYLQISPFWGWSTPQVASPERLGFTEVSTDASGIELLPRTLDQQLLGIEIGGRKLRAGERLKIVYGAGPAGAVADRFAEGESRFWIAVDGDGDGIRSVLADSPSVTVLPGPASQLLLTLPSTAEPGETVRLTAAILDRLGNAGIPFEGELVLEAVDGVELPTSVRFTAADLGRKTVELRAGEPGVLRLSGRAGELAAVSNPLQVAPQVVRVWWGDLQNHSGVSDGSGTPEEQFLYARDVAALDVVSLTDHDHWGMLFLDQHPEAWLEIKELTRRFHAPGRFVTLLGYEWTHWAYGHRHVIFFEDDGPLLSSVDPRYDHPTELWEGLRGTKALTIAHHSAGGPIATDWSIPPDPELEPITEIVSVHGSSEAMDSPSLIYRPIAGNFVRDALDRGYRFGFLGSSDGHDGHPGLGHLASPTGGLAAILAEELSRESIYRALRSRRVYATSGPRILLRVALGGYRMGADVPVVEDSGAGASQVLVVRAIAPNALSHIDVIRSGAVVDTLRCQGELDCSFGGTFEDLEVGEYLYVRVVQENGGLAWSSPFYLVAGSHTDG